jgi:hypothetical protein
MMCFALIDVLRHLAKSSGRHDAAQAFVAIDWLTLD